MVNSKYKPNKGVATRNNIFCHKCVTNYDWYKKIRQEKFEDNADQGISCPLLARQSINHSSLSIFILVAS